MLLLVLLFLSFSAANLLSCCYLNAHVCWCLYSAATIAPVLFDFECGMWYPAPNESGSIWGITQYQIFVTLSFDDAKWDCQKVSVTLNFDDANGSARKCGLKGALGCCFFLGSDGKRHCCKWAFPFVSSSDHRDLFEFKLQWAPSGSSCQMGDEAQSIQISTITVIFPN